MFRGDVRRKNNPGYVCTLDYLSLLHQNHLYGFFCIFFGILVCFFSGFLVFFLFWRLGEENQCDYQGRQYKWCQIDDEFHLLGYGVPSCVKPDDDAKIYCENKDAKDGGENTGNGFSVAAKPCFHKIVYKEKCYSRIDQAEQQHSWIHDHDITS